jgi:hypothetical protein
LGFGFELLTYLVPCEAAVVAFLSDTNPAKPARKARMKFAGCVSRLLVAAALCIGAAVPRAAE